MPEEEAAMGLVFKHETLGQRVLFGSGRAAEHLTAEVARLGAERVMVIASPSGRALAEKVASGTKVILWHTEIVMHVPAETAREARASAAEHGIDLIVCGRWLDYWSRQGGRPGFRHPDHSGTHHLRRVRSDKRVGNDGGGPQDNIYDAALTVTLPTELSVASGLNALAHCVDSMWAPSTDPINQTLAAEGIRALSRALPRVRENPEDLRGREQALYGAYLSAVAFASAGSGMHHKICHVLGGAYNLPHAQTHAILLPHVLSFNAGASPEAEQRIADALGAAGAVEGLNRLCDALDAPKALKDHGLSEEDIPGPVEMIRPVIPSSNPRKITAKDLEELLRAAWSGASAGA
jgi:maleylacetate reductase